MQGLGGQGLHPPPQSGAPAGSAPPITPPENAHEATSGDVSAKKGEPPFRACLLCRDAHTACDGFVLPSPLPLSFFAFAFAFVFFLS
jgi:hypothetical protein